MMSNDPDSATADRFIKLATVAFAIGFGAHGIDHMLRGMAASPMSVMIGGAIQGVFVVVAVALVLGNRPHAPAVAIGVGFGSAALFVYAHLLPTFFPDFQDSFVSGPRINVTWFSWLTALAEIGTGLVFGYAGLRSQRTQAKCLARVENF